MYKGPKKLGVLVQCIHCCLKIGFSLGCVLKAYLELYDTSKAGFLKVNLATEWRQQ